MLRRSFVPHNLPFSRRDMERSRRFANAFGFPSARVRPSFPAMNIWTNEDGVIVEAKLPGATPEDFEISVEGETVTVAGDRAQKALEEGEKFLRRERRYGKFSRTFQLPFAIEADEIEATFEKGILRISLPRAEADKPKKIAVKTA